MAIEDFFLGLHLKNIIVGLCLIGFGFLLGLVLSRVMIRLTTPFSGKARGKSLGRVVQWLTIVSFTVIGVLVLFGVSDATLAVVVAAITFALTFGLQNIIQNFIAGLMIAIDGRLQIGQWVEIGDQPLQAGPAEVLDISLQMVKIRESGGKVYFVPNSYIVMHKLLNISESGYLEVQVQMTLPYQADSEKVKQVLVEVARDHPHVFPNAKRSSLGIVNLPPRIKNLNTNETDALPPEQMSPVVRILKITHDGIDYLISLWTPFPEMRNEIVSDYLQRSIEGLKAANVNLNNKLASE